MLRKALWMNFNDWTDFDNSGWREGFTMGEYKEWRKTIKREQDVEGDST